MTKGKVLFITTAFAPQNAVGAIPNTKLVKELTKLGYEITVACPMEAPFDLRDITLDVPESVEHVWVTHSQFFSSTVLRSRNNLLSNTSASAAAGHGVPGWRSIKGRVLHSFYTIAKTLDWYREATRLLAVFPPGSFDVVLSAYPSAAAHLVALRFNKRKGASKWIAYFHDPMVYRSLRPSLSLVWAWVERLVCTHASKVCCVTHGLTHRLSSRHGNEEKYFYLPIGYDEADLGFVEDSGLSEDRLNLVYVGSLYNGLRNLSSLFRALRQLIDEGKVDQGLLVFTYAGNDFKALHRQAAKFGLEHVLVDKGYVSRVGALQLQAEASAIVVCTWNSNEEYGVIPGKLYEAFLLRKPILAITNGLKANSELTQMVNESRLGFAYEDSCYSVVTNESFMNYILSLYHSSVLGRKPDIDANNTYIDSFKYASVIDVLDRVLQE